MAHCSVLHSLSPSLPLIPPSRVSEGNKGAIFAWLPTSFAPSSLTQPPLFRWGHSLSREHAARPARPRRRRRPITPGNLWLQLVEHVWRNVSIS